MYWTFINQILHFKTTEYPSFTDLFNILFTIFSALTFFFFSQPCPFWFLKAVHWKQKRKRDIPSICNYSSSLRQRIQNGQDDWMESIGNHGERGNKGKHKSQNINPPLNYYLDRIFHPTKINCPFLGSVYSFWMQICLHTLTSFTDLLWKSKWARVYRCSFGPCKSESVI